jgi:hypothetical protein
LKAGNYPKWKTARHGLPISVENRKGSLRRGTDKDGHAWAVKMPAHYGYVRGTVGADGDQVDVFLGPVKDSSLVYIAKMYRVENPSRFDEHKCFLGFASLGDARVAFARAYGRPMRVEWRAMPTGEFCRTLKTEGAVKEFGMLTSGRGGMKEFSFSRGQQQIPRQQPQQQSYGKTPDEERRGMLGTAAKAVGLAAGVAGGALLLKPVIGREVRQNAMRDAVNRVVRARRNARVSAEGVRDAWRKSSMDASVAGEKFRQQGRRAKASAARSAAAAKKREGREWFKSRKNNLTPEERRKARRQFNLQRILGGGRLKEFRSAPDTAAYDEKKDWRNQARSAAGMAGSGRNHLVIP